MHICIFDMYMPLRISCDYGCVTPITVFSRGQSSYLLRRPKMKATGGSQTSSSPPSKDSCEHDFTRICVYPATTLQRDSSYQCGMQIQRTIHIGFELSQQRRLPVAQKASYAGKPDNTQVLTPGMNCATPSDCVSMHLCSDFLHAHFIFWRVGG